MKTLKQLIDEARRNSKQNQKLSAFERLKKYKGRNDIFITYTDINKVGINPHNDFNTPTAIYTYPLAQVWKQISFSENARDVPFAGSRKYIQVVKPSSNGTYIHDLETKYTKSMYERDIEILRNKYANKKTDSDPREVFLKSFNTLYDKMDWFQNQAKKLKIYNMEPMDQYGEVQSGSGEVRTGFDFMKKQLNALKALVDKEIGQNPEFTFGDYGDSIRFIENKLAPTLQVIKDETIINNDIDSLTTKDNFRKIWIIMRTAMGNVQINHSRASKLSKENDVNWSIRWGADNARGSSYGSKMWNITRVIANGHQRNGDKSAVARWNKILRVDLGYSGMADRSGKGIIHPAEPVQAIFLSTGGLKHVETIENINPRTKMEFSNLAELNAKLEIPKDRSIYHTLYAMKYYYGKAVLDRKKAGKIIIDAITKVPSKWVQREFPNHRFEATGILLYYGGFNKLSKKDQQRAMDYLINRTPQNPLAMLGPEYGGPTKTKARQKVIKEVLKFYKVSKSDQKKHIRNINDIEDVFDHIYNNVMKMGPSGQKYS